jgi:hypothetical protein
MNRIKRNQGTLVLRIASILLWIILFALFSVAAFAQAAGEEKTDPIPSPAGGVGGPDIEPSAAFPADTLLYLEVNRAVECMDILSRLDLWPEARSMFAALAEASRNLRVPAGLFIDAFASWGEASKLGKHMEVLAGKQLAAGWIPVPGSDRHAIVFVCQGSVSGDPVASLAWLAGRADEASTLRAQLDQDSSYFWITAGDGKRLFVGRNIEGRLVFSTTSGYEAMETVAAALSPGGSRPFAPLSEVEDFKQAMSRLPASPTARAFLNTPRLIDHIQSWDVLSGTAKQLFRAGLETTGGIGMARHVEPEGIRAWVTGRILEDEMKSAFPGLLESLSPIEKPLSPLLPQSALSTYEVGAPPEKVMEALGSIVQAAAPWLDQIMKAQLERFTATTGLQAAKDFFPYLENALAVAWLPAGDGAGAWPLPRTVALIRLKNREKVDRFLYEFFHWRASALAPMTGGLISAMVQSEHHEGVELMGLKIDSIIDLPLPSPAFALVDDLLVVSPVRSAVKEAVSVLQGNAPQLTGNTLYSAGSVQPDPVELIHLNLEPWEKEWDRWGEFCLSACSLLVLDKEHVSKFHGDREWMVQMGRSLSRLLGTLGRATGSTVIDKDSFFTFFIEIRLP